MQAGLKRKFRQLASVGVVGALAGLAYMPFVAEAVTPGTPLTFAAQGALIVLLVFGFELFVVDGPASESLRRARFGVVLLFKAKMTTLLIVAAYGIGGLFLFPDRFAGPDAVYDLVRDTIFAFGVSLVLQFLVLVRGIVGGRVLTNMILGRYHRPLREERIFMFLDVSGSTALAESLGGLGAYDMISRFFFDVAQETVRYGGETHEYIGDEVVVTWPLGRPAENVRCLHCYFAICDRIASKAADYEQQFGRVPQFRVSLHCGPIVAGECGDDKREIVYFGDTINTAARIQEACKDHGQPLLLSADLLHCMDLPPDYDTVGFGKIALRGREKPIELFTVRRRAGADLAVQPVPRIA